MRWAEPKVNPRLALRKLVCNDWWEEGWQECWGVAITTSQGQLRGKPVRLGAGLAGEGQSGKVEREAKAQSGAGESEARLKVIIIPVPKSEKAGSSKSAAEHPWRRMAIGKARFRAFAKN